MVKAEVCKTSIRRFESARRLQISNNQHTVITRTAREAIETGATLWHEGALRILFLHVPRWRNGRRGGLKIRYLPEVCGFESLPRHQNLNTEKIQTQGWYQ